MNQYCCQCGHRIKPTDKTITDGADTCHYVCFYRMEEQDEQANSPDTRNEYGFPITSPNQV